LSATAVPAMLNQTSANATTPRCMFTRCFTCTSLGSLVAL
jgi:hypothetical protein